MTTEERLVDALKGVDVQPSPDLYARLERSIDEDRAHRRRLVLWIPAVTALLLVVVGWVMSSTRMSLDGRPWIESWRLVVAYLALGGAVIIGLGPHLRRFGAGFLDGVFLLDPGAGRRFIRVLDIAYYVAFTGLLLVDADQWRLGEEVLLWVGVEEFMQGLALLLGAMGVLHVANVVTLPVLGLVFNSTVRRDERRRAGDSAPVESAKARLADSHAQTVVIIVLVLALAMGVSMLIGGPIGLVSGLFE